LQLKLLIDTPELPYSINTPNGLGYTSMHLAVMHLNHTAVKALIELGCTIELSALAKCLRECLHLLGKFELPYSVVYIIITFLQANCPYYKLDKKILLPILYAIAAKPQENQKNQEEMENIIQNVLHLVDPETIRENISHLIKVTLKSNNSTNIFQYLCRASKGVKYGDKTLCQWPDGIVKCDFEMVGRGFAISPDLQLLYPYSYNVIDLHGADLKIFTKQIITRYSKVIVISFV